MIGGKWPLRAVLSPQVDHEVRITKTCFPTACLRVPSHPSLGGGLLSRFAPCFLFGKELPSSVLWTIKQVFINKLR